MTYSLTKNKTSDSSCIKRVECSRTHERPQANVIFCINEAVADILYEFLSKQIGVEHVLIDPEFDDHLLDRERLVVIVSRRTIEWMLATVCNPHASACAWVVEPYISIVSFLQEKVERAKVLSRYSQIFRERLPRDRWIRFADICISDHQLACWLAKIIPHDLASGVLMHDEEKRRSLILKLASAPASVSMLRLSLNTRYCVRHGGVGLMFLNTGWHSPESEHTWMLGKKARIVLPPSPPPTEDLVCRLELQKVSAKNYLEIFVDGVFVVGSNIQDDGSPFQSIDLPLAKTNAATVIDLVCSASFKPCDLDKNSADARSIGVGLRSIELIEKGGANAEALSRSCVERIGNSTAQLREACEKVIVGVIAAECAAVFDISQIPMTSHADVPSPYVYSLFLLTETRAPIAAPKPIPARVELFRCDLPSLAGLWPLLTHTLSFLQVETFEQAQACLAAVDADLDMGIDIVQIRNANRELSLSDRQWIADRFGRASYDARGWTLLL